MPRESGGFHSAVIEVANTLLIVLSIACCIIRSGGGSERNLSGECILNLSESEKVCNAKAKQLPRHRQSCVQTLCGSENWVDWVETLWSVSSDGWVG